MKKQLLILLMLLAIITPLMATPVDDHHIAEQVNGSETDTTALLTRLLTWYDAHMNYPLPLRGGHPPRRLCGL